MNFISGRNDVGKSNLSKALNSFFNEQTDWDTPLEFDQDFSLQRLDQVESVKEKQFIQVAIQFWRPSSYTGKLARAIYGKAN
jgi:AAA15 family ATPase/GTPase